MYAIGRIPGRRARLVNKSRGARVGVSVGVIVLVGVTLGLGVIVVVGVFMGVAVKVAVLLGVAVGFVVGLGALEELQAVIQPPRRMVANINLIDFLF